MDRREFCVGLGALLVASCSPVDADAGSRSGKDPVRSFYEAYGLQRDLETRLKDLFDDISEVREEVSSVNTRLKKARERLLVKDYDSLLISESNHSLREKKIATAKRVVANALSGLTLDPFKDAEEDSFGVWLNDPSFTLSASGDTRAVFGPIVLDERGVETGYDVRLYGPVKRRRMEIRVKRHGSSATYFVEENKDPSEEAGAALSALIAWSSRTRNDLKRMMARAKEVHGRLRGELRSDRAGLRKIVSQAYSRRGQLERDTILKLFKEESPGVMTACYGAQDLAKMPYLTERLFFEMVGMTRSLDDIRSVIKARKIYYPARPGRLFDYSFTAEYLPPLTTFNRGFGVCDELALFAAPFLLHQGYRVYSAEVCQDGRSSDDSYHSVLLFRDRKGSWGYVNNLDIVDPAFLSSQQALRHAAKRTGFQVRGLKRSSIRRLRWGNKKWVYDPDASRKLDIRWKDKEMCRTR